MKLRTLRSKEVEQELARYSFSLSKKDRVELLDDKMLIIQGIPSFFLYQQTYVPTLKLLQTHCLLKKVTVDMGAVKFIVNGADIMRPGIVQVDEGIAKDEVVVIVDQQHGKPLAVGIALYRTEELKAMSMGKVVKNLHHIGDGIWNLMQE